jgi:hypothetical protein
MVSRFKELTVDCHDPRALAEFWCAVLGYEITEEEDGLVEIAGASWTVEDVRASPVVPTIVFVPVPESKTVKNRMHIDVNPIDRTQAEEVERLEALGARRIDIGQGDVHWVVMADPEGNEFCVLRSLAPGEYP